MSLLFLHIQSTNDKTHGVRLPLRKTIVRSHNPTRSACDTPSKDTGTLCGALVVIHKDYASHPPPQTKKRKACCEEEPVPQTVVYYDLLDDWNTGNASIDNHLWAMIQYTRDTEESSVSTKEDNASRHTSPSPSLESSTLQHTRRRYRCLRRRAAIANDVLSQALSDLAITTVSHSRPLIHA